jgi:hypothetical protein
MKSLNLSQVNLSTMPTKTLILSAAAILAACSRNPQPGMDETGRADTTIVADTTYPTPSDTMYRAPSDTAVVPSPQPQVTPAPDSGANTDSIGVGRDSSNVQPQVPSQVPSNIDTTGNNSSSGVTDSANVSHGAKKFEGDSAMVDHNVPDSTGNASDSTGR